MDFGELLHTAQKNEQGKKEIKYYSTKFTAPKKEQKTRTLSVNVQKFLARKEAEEKQKFHEAKTKRDKLLELRSKDKKATRRVSVMLKRTKSANQSVIEDAVDADNTSVTLAGPSQPDEDDYGYVSQEAASYYNKMMEKYSKMPEEPKFPLEKKKVSTNLSGTKDRVRAALEKEKEEAMMPHRRKRKHAESVESQADEEAAVPDIVEEKKKEPSKPKFKVPPPLNFSELLKIAEKKQFEPIVIEQKKEEEERPLTKRQKKEYEREREWRERKESRNKNCEKPQVFNRIPKLNGSTAPSEPKTSQQNGEMELKKISKKNDSKPGPSNSHYIDKNANLSKLDRPASNGERKSVPPVSKSSDRGLLQARLENKSASNNKNLPQAKLEKPRTDVKYVSDNSKVSSSGHNGRPPPKLPPQSDLKLKQAPVSDLKSRQLPVSDSKSKKFQSNDLKYKQYPPNDLKPKQVPPNGMKPRQYPLNDVKPKQCPPANVKPKQFPPNDLKPKHFPPNDLKPKQFPPADVRRKEFPPRDIKRKPLTVHKRRILDDDDEDYDSEMDDFIDDGPEGGEDYSKYISEIFGYDKNKYKHLDDDVDNMESTFAQQMREEVISTKIGIMEDLEDMKKEEEDKKRKALMKKQKK